MQALEQAEQPVGVAHVETDAIVADAEDGAPHCIDAHVEADLGLRRLRRVLPGVAEQVLQQVAQQHRIAPGHERIADPQFDAALRFLTRERLQHFTGDASQIDRRADHPLALHS